MATMAVITFSTMKRVLFLMCILCALLGSGADTHDCKPGGSASGTILPSPRQQEYHDIDSRKIFDISCKDVSNMPSWDSEEGLGHFLRLLRASKSACQADASAIKLYDQTSKNGSKRFPHHHFNSTCIYFDSSHLTGPALLVDVPRDNNITAKDMESLGITRGVDRVLLRRSNSHGRLMVKNFNTGYLGFEEDGAKWLVEKTDIKLIGFDYNDLWIPSHLMFLASMDIILVEGLKLDDVPIGMYLLQCLPLRFASPAECVLIS